MFDNLMVFLKEYFEIVEFEKKLSDDKKHLKLPSMHANARLVQTSYALVVRICNVLDSQCIYNIDTL